MPHNTPIRRVLVAYGGDRKSQDAVALGVAIARATDAELEIGLVLKTEDPYSAPYPPVGDMGELMTEQAQGWLQEAAAQVPAELSPQLHLRRNTSVVQGVLALAEELEADLLVTGSGLGRRRWKLHPVVDALLHSSPVPVAMAPEAFSAATGLTSVLVAVGSVDSEAQVVDRGAQWAVQLQRPLTLVTLQEQQEKVSDSDHAQRLTSVTASLSAAQVRLASTCELTDPLVGSGKTLAKSVASIKWPASGLLLIGSSRLAQGNRTFLGSTAARILAHLPLPTVVMPRADHTTDQEARS